MDKRTQFLQAIREGLSQHQWAKDNPAKLEDTLALVEGTMNGDRKCMIDGPSWIAAWRAIGCKGKPTYKALHALFGKQ